MSTESTRPKYDRSDLRYATDVTDAEWSLIAPHLPARRPLRRARETDLREVVNAVFYMLRAGCPLRLLPKEFPPRSTVQRYFDAWRDDGTQQAINRLLVMAAREAEGREASPSASVIDSQSVRTTESGGPRGFDADKKVKGRKRHIVSDTGGRLVSGILHSTGIQDRDGATDFLCVVRAAFPRLRHVFADAAYGRAKLSVALDRLGKWTLEIIRFSNIAQGFEILPRRWVVERTLAWLNRNRRLAKDFENAITSSRKHPTPCHESRKTLKIMNAFRFCLCGVK